MTHWYANPFTGIFTEFGPTPTRPHDPSFTLVGGRVASWLPNHAMSTASGIGADASAAEGACVGEAIERLQASPIPDDERITATFAEWPRPEPAIDPEKWVLFHADQYQTPGFPFQPLTADTTCDWVCARQALTGLPWWVPGEMMYLHQPGGHRFAPGYSTGLACGRPGHPLLLRGLQEVIERDAVVGAWWRRYPLEAHVIADVFALLGADVRDACVRPNLTYRFLRVVTPFSDHVTMVTLEGEDREGYVFSIGAACREDRRSSWEKSLQEAIHGRHYARYLKGQSTDPSKRVPASFADHAVYYSFHREQLSRTALAINLPPTFSAAHEEVAQLVARLGPDRPVLFRSMTPPALASAELGWHVVRVVAPGLQPLHGHHALPHLGGPLWSPRGLADWQAQPPHPFP